MEELLGSAQPIAEVAGLILLGLVIVATGIARLTPTPKDDEAVGVIKKYLLKILKWAPTFGVNPQTKKLEEAVKELKK